MALDNELAVDIIQSVGRYWSDNEHSDCRISVDGQVFQASRFHLSACSEFFRQVFHSESITHKENIVIKGISADVFSCVIKALFTGVNGLDESNMVDVWLAASYLKIGFLSKKCEQFIEEHLKEDTINEYVNNSVVICSDIMVNKMVLLMMPTFSTFQHTQTFLNLPFKIMSKIVESGDFYLHDNFVESLLTWANHTPVNTIGTYQYSLYTDLDQVMFTEITPENPIATFAFKQEHVIQLVGDNVDRSESLQHLIKLIDFGKFSDTVLKVIFENSLAMKNLDIKDAVMHELAARTFYKPDEMVASYSDKLAISSNSILKLENNDGSKQVCESVYHNPSKASSLQLQLCAMCDIYEIPDWVVSAQFKFRNVAPYTNVKIPTLVQSGQPAMVFITNRTILFHNLANGGCYKICNVSKINNFYIYRNELYYSVESVDTSNSVEVMNISNPANSAELVYIGPKEVSTSSKLKYFMAYPVVYKFNICEKTFSVSKSYVWASPDLGWIEVRELPLPSTRNECIMYDYIVIEDKIVFFVTGDSTRILYFDTKSEMLRTLHSEDGLVVNFKTFEKSGSYFLLLGSGQRYELVNGDTISLVFCEQQWTGTLNLYGVCFYKRLYVFSDNHKSVSDIGTSMKNNFITIDHQTWNRQCEFMIIPDNWMTSKI